MTRDAEIRRDRMVRALREDGICQTAVLDAMGRVPRELFVDETLGGSAYSDAALPIGEGQTISHPRTVARMSELTEPTGKGRVLEIGSGSGYQTAILSYLFELVYSVERIPSLAERSRRTVRQLGIENAHFKIFDGSYGWSEFAPYDAILVTAAVPEVPPPLIEQLGEGGRLVAPIGSSEGADEQVLTRWINRGGRTSRQEHGSCRFVPLVGRFGWGDR